MDKLKILRIVLRIISILMMFAMFAAVLFCIVYDHRIGSIYIFRYDITDYIPAILRGWAVTSFVLYTSSFFIRRYKKDEN